jgi:RND family efflux transporter MFP subunit
MWYLSPRVGLALALCALLPACKPAATAPPAPVVSTSRPLVKDIVEWDVLTGRLQATQTVEVRARVSGFLEAISFKDGAIVQKGDPLFVIDPRPYQATLDRTEATVRQAEAHLALTQNELQRADQLLPNKAISQEGYDERKSAVDDASASLDAARAARATAALDLEFTHVQSPIQGRASRHLVTEGNLVTGGDVQGTLLTTIVSLDPINCYVDTDERSYLKYTRLAQSGERPSSRDVPNPVWVGLADEEGFPHEGHMDFVDNQLDPLTGTMVGRAVLPNPDLLLAPGMFVRLRLAGSGHYQAMLLPDEAVGTDQSQKFVWVVDDAGHVQYRTVTVGPLHEGLRIVRTGLTADDRVIVTGVQRVRPGITVTAQDVAIESSAAPTAVR